MKLTNSYLLSLKAQLKTLKYKSKLYDKLVTKYIKSRQKVDRLIELAKKINLVYRGVPLHFWELCNDSIDFSQIVGERRAELYKSCHNNYKDGYRVRLKGAPLSNFFKDKLVGTKKTTKRQAIQIAKEWVAFAKLPKGISYS